jgi:hypothetical protein
MFGISWIMWVYPLLALGYLGLLLIMLDYDSCTLRVYCDWCSRMKAADPGLWLISPGLGLVCMLDQSDW